MGFPQGLDCLVLFEVQIILLIFQRDEEHLPSTAPDKVGDVAHLSEGSVTCCRWVLDILQLQQGGPTLFWGVHTEGAAPHTSYSLHQGSLRTCGPLVVNGRGASDLWRLFFLQVPAEKFKEAEDQSLALGYSNKEV